MYLSLSISSFYQPSIQKNPQIVKKSKENDNLLEEINLYDPIGDLNRLKKYLLRCFFIRVISVVYIFLIGVSLIILHQFNLNLYILSLGYSLILMVFILYLFGVDDIYDDKKNVCILIISFIAILIIISIILFLIFSILESKKQKFYFDPLLISSLKIDD